MRETLTMLLAWLIFGAMMFAVGCGYEGRKRANLPAEMRIDTIIVRDTITPEIREKIRYIDRVEYVPVTDTIVMRDTTYVPVRIETATYEGEDYKARVSGWHPSLDYLEVYPRTEIVTLTETKEVRKPTRWGIGVQVGYGFGKSGVTPAVTIGVNYNIISW